LDPGWRTHVVASKQGKIYAGKLTVISITDDQIKELFMQYGNVIRSLYSRGAAIELIREPEGSGAARRQVAGHALQMY